MKINRLKRKLVNAGFTLIESLFAIFILSTVIVAVMGVVSGGSRSIEQSTRSIIASPLLGESIEAMRKIRDTNYLSANDWLAGIDPECTGADGCSLDFDLSGNPIFTPCSGDCPELKIKNDKYSTDQSGLGTGFFRTILVNLFSSNEVRVNVEVTWSDRGKDFVLNSQETLRDWAPPSEVLAGPESCAVTCNIQGQPGRTIISFNDWMSYTSGVWNGDYVNTSGLSPGYYDIRIQSYDGYAGRELVSQSNERWYLEFVDNGQSPVATTGSTTDLADLVADACVFENLAVGFQIPATVNAMRPRHQSNISGSQDSVYAVCAAFDERGNTPPMITILGDNPYSLDQYKLYLDPGAIADDNEDGNITGSIQVQGTIDTDRPGQYRISYSVTDSLGASEEVSRIVNVLATTQCNDGIDNDGDGFIDYPEDRGCENEGDEDETDPVPQCSDGIDNDGDELIDIEDPECAGDPDGNSEN